MKKQEIASITDEPIDVGTIEVPLEGFWNKLLRSLGIPRFRNERLYVTGATAYTMFRITALMEDLLTESDRQGGDMKMYHLMNANIQIVCDILAIAIHNKPGTPPDWLSNAIFTQMPQARIKMIMQDVYRRLGVEDFFDTMGLIRNLNSPESDTQETAQATPQSEE